ncbi:MAG: DUF3375 domain-containing protein [Burkholderiaceae bacterium]|nr:DUF3375 domain-containing protein [Burkholderiaceae bacterium]
MNTARTAAHLHALREQPLWQLLAATKAPAVVAALRALLFDGEPALPASVMHERLARELDALRDAGEDLPQPPQTYLADWLRQGWLVRRLPEGASEETYALSVEAADAIRFLGGLLQPKTAATESRLATVIAQLARLADETDANPERRLATLQAERDRIDREMAALRGGVVRTLPDERALERAREVIHLADELTGDFRRVRDDFDRLNRGLRQSLVENDGSRGEVLEQLFAGVDLIGESDAGRTFDAFWRLLTDPGQSAALFDALESVVARPFARWLSPRERRFLLDLTARLMDEGSGVHDVLQHFARSLKAFVQSREFREQRRLHALLKEAAQAALQAKERLRANQPLDFAITLTSSRVRSVSQWVPYDPAQRVVDATMAAEATSELSLEAVADLVRQSEIDFRTLRRHIRAALERSPQVSVGELLAAFPAEQGLGTVVGYVALGARHGELTPGTEQVRWRGADEQLRAARVPAIHFIRERYVELAD